MSINGSLSSDLCPYSPAVREADGRVESCTADGWDGVLLGGSTAARRLRSQVQRIAPHFRIALIRGEAGAGKEYVARAIHALSGGTGGPFVVSEAAALAEFRAEKRFPGVPPPLSLLESASGGILFLQHVGTLSVGLQAALIRVFRGMEDRRAGAPYAPFAGLERRKSARPATRVLVACESDLRTLCAVGQFRQDLYAYLSSVEIIVPTLRERIEDIPWLAGWLLGRIAMETGRPLKVLAGETVAQLQQRHWTGNLRELEAVIIHAAAIAEGEVIEPRHLLARVEPEEASPTDSPKKSLRLHDVVQGHVLRVLTLCHGNKVRAAEMLGISRSTLYRMLEASSEHPDSN